MMKLRLKDGPWLLLPVFLLAIYLNYSRVPWQGGWGGDERQFIAWTAKDTWPSLLGYFSPTWGWFYRPLLLCYFTGLRLIVGDDVAPFYWVCLILHGCTTVFVAVTARRLSAYTWWQATPAAGLFIFATVNNEAIIWVAATNTLAVALIALVCLNLWAVEGTTCAKRFRGVVAVLVGLALLMKEEAMLIPVLILLLDRHLQPADNWRNRGRRLVPLFALIAAYLPLAVIAHAHVRAFQVQPSFEPLAGFLVLAGAVGKHWGGWNIIVNSLCCLALMWPAWSRPMTRIWPMLTVAAAFFLSLLIGGYVYQTRFHYLAAGLAAIPLVVAFGSGEPERGRLGLFILAVGVWLNPGLDALTGDYFVLPPNHAVVVSAVILSLMLWRMKIVEPGALFLTIVVSLGWFLDSLAVSHWLGWGQWFSVMAVIISGLVMRNIRGWAAWQGIVCAGLALMDPVMLPAIFVVAQLVLKGVQRMKSTRPASELASSAT